MITNIKEEIGSRILAARKAKGLTRQALANLTDNLKPSRINNWERGDRTPGPEEIKQLSKVLDISAAYLMCLTHQKQLGETQSGAGVLIPLLDVKQACEPLVIIQSIKSEENSYQIALIPLPNEINEKLGKHAFALKMPDNSMEPELRYQDILIIDPDKAPQPGNFVLAQVEDNTVVIVRRYKQLSASNHNQQFELLAINRHWADVTDATSCALIGTICGLYRGF